MSFIFSQSALVVGAAGSAANAGAETASSRPAIIAVLKILTDMRLSSFDWVIPMMTTRLNVFNANGGVRCHVSASNGNGDGPSATSSGSGDDANKLG